MKYSAIIVAIMAGVSLFIGFVIVAIGIGAIFPVMHTASADLICTGEVSRETLQYSYKPGQRGWQEIIYCTTDGKQKDITLQSFALTGLFASALIFLVLIVRFRKSLTPPKNFGSLATDLNPANKSKGSALERMNELKTMRDQNLISQVEYERKKDEIMKGL